MSRTKPRTYQWDAAKAIQRLEGRALLADEMGMGKTLEVLLWAQKRPRQRPIIVVCPAIGKWVWEAQAKEHIGMRSLVLEGEKPPRKGLLTKSPLYIINYDILSHWVDYLLSLKPKILIIDECHYIKSRRARRTKATRKLAKRTPYIIAMSGTPLTNRPAELWTTLNILRPDLYPSFFPYAMHYCKPRRTPWGWNFNGSSNLEELHTNLTYTMMIRRLKKDVLDILPKTSHVIPMGIKNRKEYIQAETNFLTWLAKYSISRANRAARAERLVQIGYLKRLAAQLKLPMVIRWIDNFLETTDGKLCVYGLHKKILRPLHKHYQSISLLTDGSLNSREKQANIKEFTKSRKRRIFFGNIMAAGTVISLPAQTLAFAEVDWVPGNHKQVEDRIHRMFTKHQCHIYYLIAKGTIEEDICLINQQKQKVVTSVLDGNPERNLLNLYDMLEKTIKQRAKRKGVSDG